MRTENFSKRRKIQINRIVKCKLEKNKFLQEEFSRKSIKEKKIQKVKKKIILIDNR